MLIRRSNLLVPLTDAAAVRDAWRHDADAVTLDLNDAHARTLMKDAAGAAGKAGAEVFVRVSRVKTALRADLEASVWPGVRGIVLPRVESAKDVLQAAEIVTALERERKMVAGSLTFIVMIETARAAWDIRAIVTSSPRISQVALDEPALAADLDIKLTPQIDPFEYARGRVIVESIAAKVYPVGMAWPLGALPHKAAPDEVHKLATKAKNLGMKGVICPYAEWVKPVNAAFTPTAELVTWNKRVREAFAAGVAAGTAAVPLDGRMIDVPVDEWAIVVLAMAEACAQRDAEKTAAKAELGG
jgi:citrate lyase subunit beta/citryl-CoA lyase